MNKPYWSVININTDEEILQVMYFFQKEPYDDNLDMVRRMVSQWFEEDWCDCGDQTEIELIK